MLWDSFPFIWKTKAIKYLGIQIPSNLEFLHDLNYKPLMSFVNNRLKHWWVFKYSWFGRMALPKIDILHCILYIF